MSSQLSSLGPDQVLCVLSTTSCFAPRAPDNVRELALLCKQAGVAHVINNAYGLQVGGGARARGDHQHKRG